MLVFSKKPNIDFPPDLRPSLSAMLWRLQIMTLIATVALLSGCKSLSFPAHGSFSHFTGITDFKPFAATQNTNGETILLSPQIKPSAEWNELVVSWNATAPAGSYLKVETRATRANHTTKFYTLGRWSPDDQAFPRASVGGQQNADGDVHTD